MWRSDSISIHLEFAGVVLSDQPFRYLRWPDFEAILSEQIFCDSSSHVCIFMYFSVFSIRFCYGARRASVVHKTEEIFARENTSSDFDLLRPRFRSRAEVTRSALSSLLSANSVFSPAAESVTFRGSFSALSAPIFASEYSLE